MLLRCARRFSASSRKSNFVDRVRIYARGGAGGQGSARTGGVGGDGGDVIVCVSGRGSLAEVFHHKTRRFTGTSGLNSSKKIVFREKAADTLINVPPGTVVWDEKGNQVADLEGVDERCVLVKGGDGGCYLTDNFQGSKGQRGVFILELKMIADIGMVGFPNAGKSTLLKALSNATPKIASYAFTTVRPQLGMMSCDNSRPITIADLPGLVEGAHSNVGMGHRFLRHIERTKVLLYVVDVNGFQLSDKHSFRDACESVHLLREELELYSAGLSHRHSVLAVNKMDSQDAEKKLDKLVTHLHSLPIRFTHTVPLSAKEGRGVNELKNVLNETLITAESATECTDIHHMINS